MNLNQIFDDAHRRVCINNRWTRPKTKRENLWTGLATPSDMKIAVKQRFMRPLHGRKTPRVLNWYLFTNAGWREYNRRFKNAPDWFDQNKRSA